MSYDDETEETILSMYGPWILELAKKEKTDSNTWTQALKIALWKARQIALAESEKLWNTELNLC